MIILPKIFLQRFVFFVLGRRLPRAFKLRPRVAPSPRAESDSAVILQHQGRSLALQPHVPTSAASTVYLSIFLLYAASTVSSRGGVNAEICCDVSDHNIGSGLDVLLAASCGIIKCLYLAGPQYACSTLLFGRMSCEQNRLIYYLMCFVFIATL